MLKKILVGLALSLALGAGGLVGGYQLAARDVASAYANGKAQGLVDGVEAGKQEFRDRSGKWFCINSETPADGNEILFCLNTAVAREQICKQAMMAAAETPGLIVHGCPDVLVVAESPSEPPISSPVQ